MNEEQIKAMFKWWSTKRGNPDGELNGRDIPELMADLFQQVYITGREDGLKLGQELVEMEIKAGALKFIG